jgi:cell wall-associated NlpC family hydrolase
MITEKDIINKYLGIPYKHRGRTLEGLDCYGLIISVYKDLGFELFDLEDYERNWSSKERNLFLLNYYRQWERLEAYKSNFDAVLFRAGEGGIPSMMVNHGGLVLSKRRFIHCCRQGTVVCRLDDAQWAGKIEGYYHLRVRTDSI